MAVAFSTDGSSVIGKKLPSFDVKFKGIIKEKYDLDYCLQWLKNKSFERIALQFPDELLTDATFVVKWLEERLESVQLFVLADTSYGSCCVDEVAAEHYSADCIVHFGHACLSPTRRLPILYVFSHNPVDVVDCSEKLKDYVSDDTSKIGIVYDMNYYHTAKNIYEAVRHKYCNTILSVVEITGNAEIPSSCEKCNKVCSCSAKMSGNDSTICVQCGSRIFYLPENDKLEDYTMFYIGSEGLTLTNLMMNWNKCDFCSYDPMTGVFRKETLNVNKVLMKRYYMVEKIKDAKIVGILVGTLGVANYLQAMERLKELLRKVGKKYYTFVVGKLNVAKLANFMEIDIYVYVSCPENSLVDSAEFYRPIVTPYEVELACNPERKWTGEYITDFQQILPGGSSHIALPEGMVEETMDISLVTGGVRNLGVTETQNTVNNRTDLIQRDNNLQITLSGADTAGEYLAGRHWQGLEPQLGKTPVTKAVEGRRGIAIGYEEEPVIQKK